MLAEETRLLAHRVLYLRALRIQETEVAAFDLDPLILGGAACVGGACILPKRWGGFIRFTLGVLGMLGIPKVLSLPHEPVSFGVVAQWAFAAH